jgi:hypothetical protein
MDFDHRGRKAPRIILLGDGNRLSHESTTEFFDQDDEDDDLENQLSRNPESSPLPEGKEGSAAEASAQREATPGPNQTSADSTSSTKAEQSVPQRASSEQAEAKSGEAKQEQAKEEQKDPSSLISSQPPLIS